MENYEEQWQDILERIEDATNVEEIKEREEIFYKAGQETGSLRMRKHSCITEDEGLRQEDVENYEDGYEDGYFGDAWS